MKTVAFVPIKLNNERTPGKNTKRFSDGTVLLTFFLETLIKITGLDEIYVFCSEEEIKKYLIPGVEFLKRPKYLNTKEATPQDIINEFMKLVDADIYAVCHCTSPFVSVKHFEQCLEAVCSGSYDSAFTGEKMQLLLWTNEYTPLNFNPENIPRTQDLAPIFCEVSAIYAFPKETFLKYRRRVGLKPYIAEIQGIECIDIDYPEDFEIADAVYMKIIKHHQNI